MSSVITQAPSANFATSTTTSVTPVAAAPTPLTTMLRGLVRAAGAQPVRDHAGLRQRERQERADGEQRDQPIGDAAEDDQQERRERREHVDAVRVHEPAAARREDARAGSRSRAISRHRRGKSAKPVLADSASTARIAPIADVVEEPRADDGRGQLRQHALIARRAGSVAPT